MRLDHLDYLACPRCLDALHLEASDAAADGHVMEGALTCRQCSTRYPLTGGIPRLLPDSSLRSSVRDRTAERFGYEWTEFSEFNVDEEVVSLTTWFRPRRLEDLAGLNVLEAGCGMGRHATIASQYGVKTLIGLDLGSAVEAAFRNTRHLPAVCIVQGDIYHPPLRPGRSMPPSRSASCTTCRIRLEASAPSPPRCGRAAGSRSGSMAARGMAGSSTSSTRSAG